MTADNDVAGIRWQVLPTLEVADARWPVEMTVEGIPVLIFRTQNGFRACEPRCPHQKASLKTATLMAGGSMVRCARHNFIFRLTDGVGVNCIGVRLKVYEVREHDGRLEIAIPSSDD